MTLLSVVQMNSQNDIEANFLVIESLIQQSKANGAELIVFPENFVCYPYWDFCYCLRRFMILVTTGKIVY